MLAVNTKLGYRPFARRLTWERTTDGLTTLVLIQHKRCLRRPQRHRREGTTATRSSTRTTRIWAS